MADAYSSWIVEWHNGKTRAYVKGWVESETDKTATIYVWACANAWQIAQYGVRVDCSIGGSWISGNTGILWCPSSTGDYAACSGRLTVSKGSSGRNVSISATVKGQTVSGYGPISGSATASANVWVGAKVLRPPSAPTNLVAARDASANIALKWKNNASNAASTLVERCKKGGSWEKILDKGSVITSHTDSPGIGSWKYRVRYWNADGYSGYSNETDYVVTLCAPAAPTLTAPASGATVDANAETVRLAWIHNSIDTSKQMGAVVRWSSDGGTWSQGNPGFDKDGSSARFFDLVVEPNTEVQWQVRTRGAYPGGIGDETSGYSPWSAVSMFLVRTAPVATLIVDPIVRSVPIPISWTYDDAMGTQSSARLEIYGEGSASMFSKTFTSERAYEVSASDFTPENKKTYTVRLTVTSTTSLSYTTSAVFEVDYVPPAKPALALSVDPEALAVNAAAFEGRGDAETPPTKFLSIYRGQDLIVENCRPGEVSRDLLVPLDRQVTYRVVAYAESGSVAERSETVVVHSKGQAVFNFGDAFTSVAKLSLNLEESDSTEGEKEFYRTASSKHPKVFYGEHSVRSGTLAGDVLWDQDWFGRGKTTMLSAFEALKESNGLVFLRLPYRDEFHVDCSVSIKRVADRYNVASVAIDWQAVGT